MDPLISNTNLSPDYSSGTTNSGVSSYSDMFDEDTQNLLALAGDSRFEFHDPFRDEPISDGFSPGSTSKNNAEDPQVDNQSDYNELSNNRYSFDEILKLYNEALEKQYSYNAQEAQKDREWQEMMSSTAYQRAFEDMKKAGINPLVALGQLNPASTPSGANASGSYASVSPLASSLVSYLSSNKSLISGISSAAIRGIATFLAAIFG